MSSTRADHLNLLCQALEFLNWQEDAISHLLDSADSRGIKALTTLQNALKAGIEQRSHEIVTTSAGVFSQLVEDSFELSPLASVTLKSSFQTAVSTRPSPLGSFAISFDIDGVLIRGSKEQLPHAGKVLRFLAKAKIPFILLTNSGGKTEAERIDSLSKVLKVPLSVKQFVQSHTPVKGYLPQFRDANILVVGGVGDSCRRVAERYGFSSVITTADLITAYPYMFPFAEIGEKEYYKNFARRLPAPINPANPATSLKIGAIFVFASSRDYGLDLQIITDLLRSEKGILASESAKNARGDWQQDGQPPLIFCNPDLYWATSWTSPRFGQGAFKAALKGIWKDITRDTAELVYSEMGKPLECTFGWGEAVLNEYRQSVLPTAEHKLSTVYHIGDNTFSDIRGAKNFSSPAGTVWKAILVETGIYEAGTVPEVEPDVTVPNVKDAITWILQQEGFGDCMPEEDGAEVEEEPQAPAVAQEKSSGPFPHGRGQSASLHRLRRTSLLWAS